MTIIASPKVVAVAGRVATWKVCCMTLVVSTGNGVTDLPIIYVQGTCWFERICWIRHTRVWKLDRPVSLELLWKRFHGGMRKLGVFSGRTSWMLLLLPPSE
jgi:hypothetical protein